MFDRMRLCLLLPAVDGLIFWDRPHGQSILTKPTSRHLTPEIYKPDAKFVSTFRSSPQYKQYLNEVVFRNVDMTGPAPNCTPGVIKNDDGTWQYAPRIEPTCTAGSCTVKDCPQGTVHVDNSKNDSTCRYLGKCVTCDNSNARGQYCPAASADMYPCPIGKYCPNFTMPVNCTPGHYCPRMSSAPIPCQSGFECSPEKQSIGWQFFVIIICALIACLLLLFFVVRWRNSHARAAIERVGARSAAEKLVYDLRVALGGPHDTGVTMKGMTQKFTPIRVTFEKLGLTLKKNDKRVLDNVSGSIAGGAMVAIMGGSGAGKTTFLNVLCGRAYYGTPDGAVYLNNQRCNMEDIRTSVGFVPQDDIMFDELSVYDNVYYQARLRLSSKLTHQQVLDIVDDVIMLFDLEEIQGTIVGSPEKRGISGGQKKRVNIAMEVVAYPRLLFLDEPTSGLDSSSAMQVMTCLSRLRCLGITVVAVIHQPRYSVFRTFSGVLLLGRGGRPVFFGPCGQVQNYFEGLGYEVPDGENIADWFIDIVSGDIDRYDSNGNVIPTTVDDLVAIWHNTFEPSADPTMSRSVVGTHHDDELPNTELWNEHHDGKSIITSFQKSTTFRSAATSMNITGRDSVTSEEETPGGHGQPGAVGNRLVATKMNEKFEPEVFQMEKESEPLGRRQTIGSGFSPHGTVILETPPDSDNGDGGIDTLPNSITNIPHSQSKMIADPHQNLIESICIVLDLREEDVKEGEVRLTKKDLRTLFVEVGLIVDVEQIDQIIHSLGDGKSISVKDLLGRKDDLPSPDDSRHESMVLRSEFEPKEDAEVKVMLQREDPPFGKQFHDLFAREFSLFKPVDYTIIVVGIAFASYIVATFAGSTNNTSTVFLFSIIVITTPMDLFMLHKTMWNREVLNGALPLPYWFTKMIRGLIDCVMLSVAWCIPWYFLSSPVYTFPDALLVFFCIAYFMVGYAHFFSVAVPKSMALLISVMFAAMFASVFGGLNPVYRNMNGFQKVISRFGQGVYAFDMFNILEVMRNPVENRPAMMAIVDKQFGTLFEITWMGFLYDVLCLLFWGTVLRFAVLIWLYIERSNYYVFKVFMIYCKRTFFGALAVPGYVFVEPFRKKKVGIEDDISVHSPTNPEFDKPPSKVRLSQRTEQGHTVPSVSSTSDVNKKQLAEQKKSDRRLRVPSHGYSSSSRSRSVSPSKGGSSATGSGSNKSKNKSFCLDADDVGHLNDQ